MGRDKKGGSEEKPDTTMWMVTFGDLLMLLLTFFVMLLTMSSMDSKALKSIFSIFEGGLGVLEFSDLAKIDTLSDRGDLVSLKASDLATLSSLNAQLDNLMGKGDGEGGGILDDLFESGGDSEGILGDLGEFVELSKDERGVVLTLQASVLFRRGEAEVLPAMFPLLDAVGVLLNGLSNDVLIMGHTDDVPMRGKVYRSNWELSIHRALNVQKYILEKKYLKAERFGVGGYGDLRPWFSNETEEGRKKNRRVEIILRGA